MYPIQSGEASWRIRLCSYKIPTRLDMGKLHVEFETSDEPTGPYGAKSIGEVVINTPAPAIAHTPFSVLRECGIAHCRSHRKKSYLAQRMNKHILYLEAGSSRRFGANKLLMELNGKPLYRHGFDLLLRNWFGREKIVHSLW